MPTTKQKNVALEQGLREIYCMKRERERDRRRGMKKQHSEELYDLYCAVNGVG